MIIRLLIFALLMISCFAQAMESPVVVLLSDENKTYQKPKNAFISKQKKPVFEFNLKGNINLAPTIMSQIMAHKPALIFALGAKAAWFAKAATKNNLNTKVIFAMVLNWQRYKLLDGQKNITGISADIAPGTQLYNLSLLSPKVKKVGVIYSAVNSREAIVKAKDAALLLGMELVLQPIDHASHFQRAWRKISNNLDAFWVVSDPVSYTMENIHWLNSRCIKESIICVGQSDNISKLGVLLSVNPDMDNLGLQAASIADKILSSEQLIELGNIVDPIATKVTFNRHTADKIGLVVGDHILSLVNNVIVE